MVTGQADQVCKASKFSSSGGHQIAAPFLDLIPWWGSTETCTSEFVSTHLSRPLYTVEANLGGGQWIGLGSTIFVWIHLYGLQSHVAGSCVKHSLREEQHLGECYSLVL